MIHKNEWFTTANIIGNTHQRSITIPHHDWSKFPVNNRVKIVSIINTQNVLIKKVKAIGNGKQRMVNISRDDWDIFEVGDKVILLPQKQTDSQTKDN